MSHSIRLISDTFPNDALDRLQLPADEVHVWQTDLEPAESEVTILQELLSTDEQERAQRFLRAQHRQYFTVARATLRRLLGFYLGIDPRHVRFSYNAFGKPALAESTDLQFSVSHSSKVAVYAFTRGREVGIDVERVRADFQCEPIAQRFFAAAEYQALCNVAPALRPQAFFAGWTRKEAFIKAVGQGLSYPLDQFEVSLTPGAPAQLLRIGADPNAAKDWSLWSIAPAPGYIGAVVIAPPVPLD
ncbi:MAG: 4'-phosphopantetheinyl transferase superfamily protein [Gammaproteobacteria bacterium]|nr:4'-phosphopantetheinyl transferase superfamily protein [Gammaproteobacteria bacterium]